MLSLGVMLEEEIGVWDVGHHVRYRVGYGMWVCGGDRTPYVMGVQGGMGCFGVWDAVQDVGCHESCRVGCGMWGCCRMQGAVCDAMRDAGCPV